MRRLPPFHYFLYVLGTVNLVSAVVLVCASLAFNEGVNIVSMAVVVLVINAVSVWSVVREFRGSR